MVRSRRCREYVVIQRMASVVARRGRASTGTLYRTPGRSRTRPPRTSTIECSWRLWPSPGMYAVISTPLDSRTRAIFLRAELGFFGVWVDTRTHTPRRWGEPLRAGVADFSRLD